jgi:hypothetical protein
MRKGIKWNVAIWVLTLGVFGLAMFLSYREVQNNTNDLRRPAVLLVNALLATIVAFGFAVREGSLKGWADVHLCFRFGFWSAAIFRLVPLFPMEQILFIKNSFSVDVPYIILFAFIHGGLAFSLSSPIALRLSGHSTWTPNESLMEMCGATILLFFIVTVVVRLSADSAVFNW